MFFGPPAEGVLDVLEALGGVLEGLGGVLEANNKPRGQNIEKFPKNIEKHKENQRFWSMGDGAHPRGRRQLGGLV